MTPLSPEEFQVAAGVSRETIDSISVYLNTLKAWQPRINLVGSKTLEDPWRRHILDSAQLVRHLLKTGAIADLGSGAGFPGLVISLLTGREVILIESDQRKAAFLREAARRTSARCQVVCDRIETIDPDGLFDPDSSLTVTARACAPLGQLLEFASHLARPRTRLLFLKGQSLNDELTAAAKNWTIEYDVLPSESDPSGRILLATQFHQNVPHQNEGKP